MKKNYSLPVLTKEDVKFADSGQSTRSFQDCNVTFNEQVKITQTFIDIAHMVHTLGTDHNLLHFSFKLKMLIQKVCRQRLHLVR